MKHYGSRTSLLHPHYERGFNMIPIDGTNFKSDMRELNRHDQAVSELLRRQQLRQHLSLREHHKTRHFRINLFQKLPSSE
jgi:hypothetical protein